MDEDLSLSFSDSLAKIKHFYFKKWRECNTFFKVIFILSLPFRIIVELTVPPVEHKLYHPYQKYIYPITTPLASLILLDAQRFTLNLGLFSIDGWLFTLLIGSIVSICLILIDGPISNRPTPEMFYLILSLFGSALRITFLVKIVLNAVRLLQVVSGFSRILLGTLVIALGSCYPDLIINTTLVQKGYNLVAIANAFSAELINLLLGFGLSCLSIFLIGDQNNKSLELFEWKKSSRKLDFMMVIIFGGAVLNQVYLFIKVIIINRSKLYLHDAYIGIVCYVLFVLGLLSVELFVK